MIRPCFLQTGRQKLHRRASHEPRDHESVIFGAVRRRIHEREHGTLGSGTWAMREQCQSYVLSSLLFEFEFEPRTDAIALFIVHAINEADAAGTAFAISYQSDIKKVTQANLVVFTVRYK